MRRSALALVLVMLAGTAAAQINDFRYSFIQASYSKSDYDNLGIDGDGLGVSASFELTDNFHIFGGYAGADIESNADSDGWNAGVGLNVPLGRQMDVVARLSYQSTEIDVPVLGTVEDDGFGLGVGVRVGANESIELNLGLTYIDLDSGNETVFDAGFFFNFANDWAIGVSTSWDDDVSVLSLNGRLYFE